MNLYDLIKERIGHYPRFTKYDMAASMLVCQACGVPMLPGTDGIAEILLPVLVNDLERYIRDMESEGKTVEVYANFYTLEQIGDPEKQSIRIIENQPGFKNEVNQLFVFVPVECREKLIKKGVNLADLVRV